MKLTILFLLMVFCFENSFAQQYKEEPQFLYVEKKVTPGSQQDEVNLQFKSGRYLKIRTSDGQKLLSRKYAVQDSAIVFYTGLNHRGAYADTIPFQDIVKIRGKVYGNTARKAGGVLMVLASIPVAVLGFVAGATGNTPSGTILFTLPGLGLYGLGFSMTGSRSFDTTTQWALKTTSDPQEVRKEPLEMVAPY